MHSNLFCLILSFCFSKSYETSGNVEQEEKEEQEGKEIEKKGNEEALVQFRKELMDYDFHKCPRIKKEAFQDFVVEDIDLIRIAVIGPTGAGKTSLLGERFLPFSSNFNCTCLATAKWLVDQQAS